MRSETLTAPGKPGMPSVWSRSAKLGVGTANTPASNVWFTLAEGIVTEVFYPRVDTAAIRDLQFMVSDGRGFFSEQRRDTDYEIAELSPGIPAYRVKNTCKQGRYSLEYEIACDTARNSLLMRVRFTPGGISEPRLYVLLAPHLENHGEENNAWTANHASMQMLLAQAIGEEGQAALALACSRPFRKMSAGYVGFSDGWQDVKRHGQMEWEYDCAPDGNIALTAEIDFKPQPATFELALGFGTTVEGAALNARASLMVGFDFILQRYTKQWADWQKALAFDGDKDLGNDSLYRTSTMVIRCHEAKDYPGAIVASLSTPWGEARHRTDGGYHIVWTRDLIEAFGGILAAGAHEEARRVLTYLHATQQPEGDWPQNMWIDGRVHQAGIQLDEIGLPILAVVLAAREPKLNWDQFSAFWPTIRNAAQYLMKNGPVTRMGRWEEYRGFSPFTLAVIISALLVAAEHAEKIGENSFAEEMRRTADEWNSRIEEWIYVSGTELAEKVGVEGYYAFSIPEEPKEVPPAQRPIWLPAWIGAVPPTAGEIVSPDALALVRFGLRSPRDPRILNTIKVIDAVLKVETPHGPCWRRYNGDGYGEKPDGSPFYDDQKGIGRAWPLLTGERAHYELAAGNRDEAIRLMRTMEGFASGAGMLPEQIWDAPDIPAQGLFFGSHTGSAMPLVWTHSEYLKLRRSIHDNHIFDMPEQTVKRYLEKH